jgi:hypothetical protein
VASDSDLAPRFVYAVRSRFTDAAVRAEFIAWLTGGHLADVVRAGATRAELVLHEPAPGETVGEVESRYLFASPEAFAAYEAGPAIPLRAEGAAKFPPTRGVTMTRSTATSACRVG